MKHNTNTHKIITIPIETVDKPNITKINVKKKCNVLKMPISTSINNNTSKPKLKVKK